MKLKIKNLTKTYKNGVKALDDITIEIGTGMFGLLGPNGAGKSSLMRTIATLQSPDSGSINFNDIEVLEDPMSLRKVLGYLPQSFGVYPKMSAEDLLHYFAKLKGISSKSERNSIVKEVLEITNLYDVRKKYVAGYSGGMKQRFGIAQALLNNPKLIIVDEPTAGLDPIERNRFYNLLSELSTDKILILSTHIVEDISTLCNDMAIIGSGKVLLTGKPEILEKSLEGKLWELEIDKSELANYQEKYLIISNRFHLGKMKITAVSDNQPERSFYAKKPSLEDLYFNEIKSNEQSKKELSYA